MIFTIFFAVSNSNKKNYLLFTSLYISFCRFIPQFGYEKEEAIIQLLMLILHKFSSTNYYNNCLKKKKLTVLHVNHLRDDTQLTFRWATKLNSFKNVKVMKIAEKRLN